MTTYELVGRLFVYTASVLLGAILGGVLTSFAAKIWMEASNKWRAIFKTERLILDYYRNRDEFKLWLKEKEEREAE